MGERVVHLVRTGIANTASLVSMLERLNARVEDVRDAGDVERARAVVLPGVGAFGAGMERLRRAGLVEAMRARVDAGRATLCVCLGMQLLCGASEETPGETGLGVIDVRVERFAGPVRVPQMGWNRVRAGQGATMLVDGVAYFANSYRIAGSLRSDLVRAGWACATSEYSGEFVCGMERRDVLACQFHPELSGAWGLGLVSSWLDRACGEAGAPRTERARAGEGVRC